MVGHLESEVEGGEVSGAEAIRDRLVELARRGGGRRGLQIDLSARPAVVMVVGVNGTGKTTTVGKLAWHLARELGLSVIVAAADTYRAAAMEQLEQWAERAGAEIVRGSPGGDPGAVVFDAIVAGQSRGADVVIADTAGRLHTHSNLMAELAKVRRVASKQLQGAPNETLIVVDATTGQNGLRQAQAFAEAVDLTGVVLTKLDGTAKGGIALAIHGELAGIGMVGVRVRIVEPGDPGELWAIEPLVFDVDESSLVVPLAEALGPTSPFPGRCPRRFWPRSAAAVRVAPELAPLLDRTDPGPSPFDDSQLVTLLPTVSGRS